LENGDIISIDCGVLKNGFYGDHAYTFEVGEVTEEVKKLLKITKESLYMRGFVNSKQAIEWKMWAMPFKHHVEKHGYGVVRELVGHGLGTKMHEDPQMPNYGKRGRGKMFVEGMVVAIEPMINMGTHKIDQLRDGWTILTRDRKPSAHFEHDVAIDQWQTPIAYLLSNTSMMPWESKAMKNKNLDHFSHPT
jgi:methionyl aminopeptidase